MEDLEDCIITLQALQQAIRNWRQRGGEIVIDITGGPEPLSAALALVARKWPCDLSYVGTSEHTMDGVGVTISGKEFRIRSRNPWNTLTYQVAEDALSLADAGNFAAASTLVANARDRAEAVYTKRALETLTDLLVDGGRSK